MTDRRRDSVKARRKRNKNVESESAEYRVWNNMKNRCRNPKYREYHLYGGRGIQVCARWSESYKAFVEDMGRRPSLEHSIERRDVDGNYEPQNCYWATRIEQGRNKRNSRLITHNGETKTLAAWAEDAGMDIRVLFSRLKLGWAMERALSRPITPGAQEHLGETRRTFKLTAEEVIAIRSSSERTLNLAARYGVHRDTIRRIRNGTTRQHAK